MRTNKYEYVFKFACLEYRWPIYSKSTRDQDIEEHWDFDVELPVIGRSLVDVKAPKVVRRGGDKPCIWWEWRNVRGGPGWGVPCEKHRQIAQYVTGDVCHIGSINNIAQKAARLTDFDRVGRDPWCVHDREKYGNSDLMTAIPIDWFVENCEYSFSPPLQPPKPVLT